MAEYQGEDLYVNQNKANRGPISSAIGLGSNNFINYASTSAGLGRPTAIVRPNEFAQSPQQPEPKSGDWLVDLQKRQAEPWSKTQLDPKDERDFRNWMYGTKLFNSIKSEVAQENELSIDSIDNDRLLQMLEQSGDYDYRGAFKKGITEEISPHDGRPHWPSRAGDGSWLKSPQHETAWKEIFMQHYGVDPDDVGFDTLDKAIAATRDPKSSGSRN